MAAIAPRLFVPDLAEEDPVLHAVRTAPVEPGVPPADEAEILQRARAGSWRSGGAVTAEIASAWRATIHSPFACACALTSRA